jgi:predicted RNase H-like HicB family nuclease
VTTFQFMQGKILARDCRNESSEISSRVWEETVEKVMRAYHVAYERDESGWWVASVREVRGCHTQGRTVDEARRRILKAMELFVDDARSAKIIDNVRLPAPASKAIRLYAALRKQADREDQRASRAARRAVRLLRGGKLKMSARDAARLLGVSHQRVHQLVHDAG